MPNSERELWICCNVQSGRIRTAEVRVLQHEKGLSRDQRSYERARISKSGSNPAWRTNGSQQSMSLLRFADSRRARFERFYTESNYPVPIFRYDVREPQAVLPKEANAYELVGDPARTASADGRETCLVQGYRVEIDHAQRLVRQDALANDYDRMMQLLRVA